MPKTPAGTHLSNQTVLAELGTPGVREVLSGKSVRFCSKARAGALAEGHDALPRGQSVEYGEVRIDGHTVPVFRRRGAKRWITLGTGFRYFV